MSSWKFHYNDCYSLGFSLLNASLRSSQLRCYLPFPLVSLLKTFHFVLFALPPILFSTFLTLSPNDVF